MRKLRLGLGLRVWGSEYPEGAEVRGWGRHGGGSGFVDARTLEEVPLDVSQGREARAAPVLRAWGPICAGYARR